MLEYINHKTHNTIMKPLSRISQAIRKRLQMRKLKSLKNSKKRKALLAQRAKGINAAKGHLKDMGAATSGSNYAKSHAAYSEAGTTSGIAKARLSEKRRKTTGKQFLSEKR
jgi:hypothetical protein